jgi:hypothetical protein
VVGTLAISLIATGCTRTTVHKVARFEPGAVAAAAPTSQPVPKLALWKVKVRGHREKDYHAIEGTERLLQAGDVVGFRTGDDGVTYAIANKEAIPLALSAAEHRRVVWYASVEEPTQFGENLAAAGELAVAVAAGAAIVGAVVGIVWLNATTEDDDDCHSWD